MEPTFDFSAFELRSVCAGFAIREAFDVEPTSECIKAVTPRFEKDSNPNT